MMWLMMPLLEIIICMERILSMKFIHMGRISMKRIIFFFLIWLPLRMMAAG